MRNVIEIFNFIATQTKTTKKYDFVDKYGKSNVIIAAICIFGLDTIFGFIVRLIYKA